MTGILALVTAAVVSFVAIVRDPAVGRGAERFVVAASWPVMIALFGVLQRSTTERLGFAGVVAAVCVATLGRPALIMDRALTDEAKKDPRLTRRKVAGVVALLASAGVAAAWSLLSP